MSTSAVFAGIDVSKARLELAVRPDEIEWRNPNTDAGAREVADGLKDQSIPRCPGGYRGAEISVASALTIPGVQ